MTKRKEIDLLRKGYIRAWLDYGGKPDDAEVGAARQYPYPTKKVTQIAYTTSGQYKIEDGIVYHRLGDKGVWREACLDIPDLQALARIVKAPFVEVDDMD